MTFWRESNTYPALIQFPPQKKHFPRIFFATNFLPWSSPPHTSHPPTPFPPLPPSNVTPAKLVASMEEVPTEEIRIEDVTYVTYEGYEGKDATNSADAVDSSSQSSSSSSSGFFSSSTRSAVPPRPHSSVNTYGGLSPRIWLVVVAPLAYWVFGFCLPAGGYVSAASGGLSQTGATVLLVLSLVVAAALFFCAAGAYLNWLRVMDTPTRFCPVCFLFLVVVCATCLAFLDGSLGAFYASSWSPQEHDLPLSSTDLVGIREDARATLLLHGVANVLFEWTAEYRWESTDDEGTTTAHSVSATPVADLASRHVFAWLCSGGSSDNPYTKTGTAVTNPWFVWVKATTQCHVAITRSRKAMEGDGDRPSAGFSFHNHSISVWNADREAAQKVGATIIMAPAWALFASISAPFVGTWFY